MKSHLRVHPVVSGENQGPTAWGLSVTQTFIFGASVGAGFILFSLLQKAGWDAATALVVAGLLPLLVFLFFLTLVVRKPASYARNWWAWQRMRLLQKPLFNIQSLEK